MNPLRRFLFALTFYPATVLMLLATLAGLFSPAFVARMASAWARLFLVLSRWCLGIRLVVRGTIPGRGLVAVKHQSMYETIAILALLPRPVVIMKEELRHIPLWGRIATAYGSVFVERKRGTAALRNMLRSARAHEGDGRPLVIFPEGTRVPVGESPPLKSGVTALYEGLGVPVTPVALDAGRLWQKGGKRRPGTVTMLFGEPLPPGLPRREFRARLHEAINRASTLGTTCG